MKNGKGNIKKNIIIITISLITAVVLIGGVFFWVRRKGGSMEFPFVQGGMNGMNGMMITEDTVAASGVINVGVTEESFEVEDLSTALVIEEVYVGSGTEITQGTKILKLSEESVEAAREELEQTLRSAELAYRAGTIEYEQNKITAKYDYEAAVLAGEQAQTVYEETMSGLTDSVERAEEEVKEAQEKIAEYQSYVNNDSYRAYFQVDEYQAVYDENFQLLKDKVTEWEVPWEQVTGGGMGQREPYSYASILAQLYKVLEDNEKNLKQAQSDYEDALTNASFELQTLELQLPSLQQALTEAKENYEIQAGQAKLTREKTLAAAERAENDYETALEKAEADYETLTDDYEDAKGNLALFESSVGDGCFYASSNGSILRTMVREGQELTSDRAIFMYSNPAEMTVTVSVGQIDIAKLSVGDEAYIQLASGTGVSGIVAEINPITASDSRTNITYSVTVTLTGDTTGLTANQSVTVLFGMTAENMQIPSQEFSGEGGFPGGDMEMPEGGFYGDDMEFPTGGEFPVGGFQPSEGQRGSGERDGRGMTD